MSLMLDDWNKELSRKRRIAAAMWVFNCCVTITSVFMMEYTKSIEHWSTDAWKYVLIGSSCFKVIISGFNIALLFVWSKNAPSRDFINQHQKEALEKIEAATRNL